jgi:hypothetical protein
MSGEFERRRKIFVHNVRSEWPSSATYVEVKGKIDCRIRNYLKVIIDEAGS